jgi:predicted SAM-dependent methyltransferase
MANSNYNPNYLFESYKNYENNNILPMLKFNILQELGQFKNKFFKQKSKYQNKEYLHLGCGPNIFCNWVNLDAHTKKSILSLTQDEIFRHDLRKRLPFSNNCFTGIYTEHCLEHLNPKESFDVLSECFRVLKNGGTLRVIVPDAEKYAKYYLAKITKSDTTHFGEFNGWKLGAEALRGLTCYLGHYTLYDTELLVKYLEFIGFSEVKTSKCGESADLNLMRDMPEREWNSLYVEAIK